MDADCENIGRAKTLPFNIKREWAPNINNDKQPFGYRHMTNSLIGKCQVQNGHTFIKKALHFNIPRLYNQDPEKKVK